jgi:sugar phosphate isomerase/epimerase
MKLVTYRNLWGMTGDLTDQLRRVREGGYDGIEWTMPSEADEPRFRATMRDLGLRYIAVVSTPAPAGSPEVVTATADTDHVAEYRRAIDRAMSFEPDKISTNVGHDAMTDDEAFAFFEAASKIDQGLGVPVAHETHRRRILYTPWRTAEVLRRFPSVMLCADLSHWVVVAARLLDDRPADLALALQRTIHTQGRVGYPHGPQVSDPRAPEHAKYLAHYEGWWAEIIGARLAAGDAEFTFQPEYGPAEYLHLQPYTMQPVVDLWDVNLWARDRFRTFYEQTVARLRSRGTHSGQ